MDFLDITTLYSSPEDRSILNLSEIYNDHGKLEAVIRGLIDHRVPGSFFQGKKVLIKPNWVNHSKSASDEICLRTHDRFTLAVLKIILEKSPAEVVIGDAPIQGCRWDKMITADLLESVALLSRQFKIPVRIIDFRRVTFDPARNNLLTERNPISDYVIFDLGRKSYLEPITLPGRSRFRVTNYNPDRFNESHKPGMHKYCITRELFDADIVLSLPKIKTHQKAGITAALKNIVGLNGDKDFLPHHRLGGAAIGGDCYPGRNPLRYLSELASDQANRNLGKFNYWVWLRLSSLLWRLSFPTKVHDPAAAWYGNDTTWRMVMDLNQIVRYGKFDGTMSDAPRRKVFSLCDGIIGGQGNGPLNPDPLPLGVVCLSDNPGITDICMATLMGFDFKKIPLLAAALVQSDLNDINMTINSGYCRIDDLKQYSVKTVPPPGWLDYFGK